MAEPLSNLRFVCDTHAPRPVPDLAIRVGGFVKRAFASPQGNEHMWVRVTSLDHGIVTGVLDNDPLLDVGIACGDTVSFRVTEVEDVLPA